MQNFRKFLEQRNPDQLLGGLSKPAHAIPTREKEQEWAKRFRGEHLFRNEPWKDEYLAFKDALKQQFLTGEISMDKVDQEVNKKIQEFRLKHAGWQNPVPEPKQNPYIVPTTLNSAIDELQHIVTAYKRDGNAEHVVRAIMAWSHRWHND